MRAYLRLLLLFALTAGAAYLASRLLVPNAVPADSEQPQWYLQLAFVLRSIELIGLGGIVLVLVAGLAAWFGGRSPTKPVR
ncbi:hypothetical protein [Bradyrhizobium lablabi]|uniref:hypothetical protein n=1 Tax=Bradyrhizobium lablabi TaxID=722472 RepID=UPI0009098E8E|nr:hypothetical protein [Bradyrhizobium lablabi]SHM41720.1 hypothetical protein SAMN05444321_6274 [Bradyrhizobium lablabi]